MEQKCTETCMNSSSDETQAMHDATNVLHPQRTIVELKELRALTGSDDGAQRVAFTPTWANAREWLKGKMAELPVESHADAAGNLWFTLAGKSERCLIIGGHIDSVPNGGWLDGCLNVMAGVEILRRIIAEAGGHIAHPRHGMQRQAVKGQPIDERLERRAG